MDRKYAFIAIVACLTSASGCQRVDEARGVMPVVRADLAELGARIVPARPPMPEEEVASRPPEREETPSDPPMSPEAWLSAQAAAAWSGKRDRAEEAQLSVVPSSSATPEGEPAATVAASAEAAPAVASAEAPPAPEEPAAVASAEVPSAPEEAVAPSDEVAQNETEASKEEPPPEETAEDDARANQEYWRQMASLLGAGSGFTGEGAGKAGYTGVSAGQGFTGIGAGDGFTGVGAGNGYTGMFANVPAEGGGSAGTGGASTGRAGANQPQPVVVIVPSLLGWRAGYVLY